MSYNYNYDNNNNTFDFSDLLNFFQGGQRDRQSDRRGYWDYSRDYPERGYYAREHGDRDHSHRGGYWDHARDRFPKDRYSRDHGSRDYGTRDHGSRDYCRRDRHSRPTPPDFFSYFTQDAAPLAAKNDRRDYWSELRERVWGEREERKAREAEREAARKASEEARKAMEEAKEAAARAEQARKATLANFPFFAISRAQELPPVRGPKILKKIETEDQYQIQIFKDHGDFSSYEVKAVKSQQPFVFQGFQPQILDIIIQSTSDDFTKKFQFNMEDIEVNSIDWEWYKDDNVLVLNIPKKRKVCDDAFASIFGIPQLNVNSARESSSAGSHNEDISREAAARRRAAQEKASRVAHERARREAIVRARKEAERAERAKVQEQERAERQRREAERYGQPNISLGPPEVVQFLGSLLGPNFISQFQKVALKDRDEVPVEGAKPVPQVVTPAEKVEQSTEKPVEAGKKDEEKPVEKPTEEKPTEEKVAEPEAEKPLETKPVEESPVKENSTKAEKSTAIPEHTPEPFEDLHYHDLHYHDHSDNDSISSDVDTPVSSPEVSHSTSSLDKLHKSISLEEVEDEEFVMFRKKFGEK